MYYQFPAVVNIDAESKSSETQPHDQVKRHAGDFAATSKGSTVSVNTAKSLNSNNDSSDTDEYTDDDDDDIMIVQEERKSLFSALKSRMNDRGSERSLLKESIPPKVTIATETSCQQGAERKKISTKHKRTSEIVDLSFSDDDRQEDQNHLHSYAIQMQTSQDDCVLVEAQKAQVNKMQPLCQDKDARTERFAKNDRRLLESSPSDHGTNVCEDSDDLPCILPSSLHLGSEGSSHSYNSFPSSYTDNYKSSDYNMQGSNVDSQEDSEIPTKRKKRSPEEIMRQRNEALVSIR